MPTFRLIPSVVTFPKGVVAALPPGQGQPTALRPALSLPIGDPSIPVASNSVPSQAVADLARATPAVLSQETHVAAPSPSAASFVHRKFTDAIIGLHPKEVENLQSIYDQYDVLDCRGSGFVALDDWIEKLTERLTESVTKIGESYPEYRVAILDSDEVNAFVHKHRSAGQKYYRGHVFISIGLIRRMAATLLDKKDEDVTATDIASIDPKFLAEILSGTDGVSAHEFGHPKEDEVIKWELRGAQDYSAQNHGQADETATDLMALKILKGARLPASDMLAGLELLYGHKPSSQPLWLRGAAALTSSHPEANFRMNIVRGGLIYQRRDEGRYVVEPIAYDEAGMRENLARLFKSISREGRIEKTLQQAREHGETPVARFAAEALVRIRKGGEVAFPRAMAFEVYCDEMDVLAEITAAYPPQGEADEAALTHFFEQTYEFRKSSFANGLWTVNASGLGGTNSLTYSPSLIRRAGQIHATHPILKLECWRKWIASKKEKSFWEFVEPVQTLAVFLPPDTVAQVIHEVLARIGELPEEVRVQKLLEIGYTSTLIGVAQPDVELAIPRLLLDAVKTSDKALGAVIGNLHNIFENDVFDSQGHQIRTYWIERFRNAPELLQGYADLIWELLAHPKPALADRGMRGALSGEWGQKKWLLEILQWALSPNDFPKPFDAEKPQSTHALATRFENLLASAPWQSHLRAVFQAKGAGWKDVDALAAFGETQYSDYGLAEMLAFKTLPFTRGERNALCDAILGAVGATDPESPVFRGSVLFEAKILKHIQPASPGDLLFWAAKMAERLRNAGVTDVLAYLEARFEGPQKMTEGMFANGECLVLVLDDWRRRGILDESAWQVALDRYVFPVAHKKSDVSFERIGNFGAHALWRQARESGIDGVTAFLGKIARHNRIEAGVGEMNQERRNLLKAEILTAPDFAKPLDFIREGLGADFRGLLGLGRHPDSKDFTAALNAHYADALDFLTAVFNPDGQTIPATLRGVANFHHLDGPAETLIGAIPKGAFDGARSLEVWNVASAKRANRYTDLFFENDVLPYIESFDRESKLAVFNDILTNGRIRSERLRNKLMEVVMEDELETLSARASLLSDRDVMPILFRLDALVPDASRFRDDLLEKIAWKLELSEAQTLKFIEPKKSFSFRAINPLTVNLLSGLSAILSKLKASEKLALVRYIRNPHGSLQEALPWLPRFAADVDLALRIQNIKDFDWLDRLEGFIRDAGEGDRLVLIEMLVGTPVEGLWYAPAKITEELYKLAGLEAGSLKRKLFNTYLKALPAHEHSATLSYLIAMQSEGAGGSELLRILETFDTPGIKFAQMASILGIFGAERSEELAKAKDRALPPSRAQVFASLREALPPWEFAKIKRVRVKLGSGSVKFVVLIEYDDGGKEAALIRRPWLDERIASTMEIGKAWAKELSLDPEFAAKYDFDYYLDALGEQLDDEIVFSRELELSRDMAAEYAFPPSRGGWHFTPLPPSEGRVQNDKIMQFKAIEGAIPLHELPEVDRKVVSEMIVAAELDLLLRRGHFDADRHLGNYLFDPVTKSVYPIDMGQTYSLSKNGVISPGDRYAVAELLYGLSDENAVRGARTLTDCFLRLARERDPALVIDAADLAGALQKILADKGDIKSQTVSVLAELNRRRIRLPLRFSMGIIKGLMIVLHEDYAKEAGPEFARERIASFIRREMFFGARFKAASWVRGALA